MSDYNLQIVCHKDASPEVLNRVIVMKQNAWPYPKESQMKWIEDNLQQGDIHVFLQDDNKDVAYLNLVQIQANINDRIQNGLGIGNVCAKIRGRGYGRELLNLTNAYLNASGKFGLLFCHKPLVQFYSGCNWMLLSSEKCINPKLDEGIYAMVYNTPVSVIDFIDYKGKLF